MRREQETVLDLHCGECIDTVKASIQHRRNIEKPGRKPKPKMIASICKTPGMTKNPQ